MQWLKHATERYSSGHFGFDKSFFPFIYHAEGFRETIYIADATVILTIVFFATALIYVFYKRKNSTENDVEKNVFRTVLPLGLFCFFMVTPLSRPLWLIFTPLQKVQFPARWMNVTTLCATIVATAAIHYLLKGNFLKQRIWIYTCLSFVFVVGIFNFVFLMHPTSFAPHSREKFESRIAELPEYESFDCWWTIWARREAFDTKEKVIAENRPFEIADWKTEQKNFIVAAGKPTKARVATFYYPHWQASVNGVQVEIEKDENGVMLIPLPAEKSVVNLSFREPPAVKIASVISVAVWLFFAATFLFFARRKFLQYSESRGHFAEAELTC